MRTSIALAAGIALALGTATAAFATDDSTTPGAAGAAGATGAATGAAAAGHALQGEVTEKQGDTLTIRRSDGQRAEVKTTASTKVRGQNGELDVDDIATGDRVYVTPMKGAETGEHAGAHVAREIQIVAREGAGDTGTRDPRQMSPQQNPIQGTPDNTGTR